MMKYLQKYFLQSQDFSISFMAQFHSFKQIWKLTGMVSTTLQNTLKIEVCIHFHANFMVWYYHLLQSRITTRCRGLFPCHGFFLCRKGEPHCKYIACKKGSFSLPFISHTFSMYFWLSSNCIKCSENNVKFILEWFLKLTYSMVVGTSIM